MKKKIKKRFDRTYKRLLRNRRLKHNEKLRKKLGKDSIKMVDIGKLSIKARYKQLRRIYEEALEN